MYWNWKAQNWKLDVQSGNVEQLDIPELYGDIAVAVVVLFLYILSSLVKV